MSLESYLRAAPKVELHVHLEGSIRPATLLELARRNRVELPAEDEAGLAAWFTFRDFDHFVKVYMTVSRCLRGAEDYELVTVELGRELARQNVRHAEVTTTPSLARHNRVAADAYLRGLARGRERVHAEHAVSLDWVFDIVRNLRDENERKAYADHTTEAAIEGMGERGVGVVALGLGGMEAGYPPEPYSSCFDRARKSGLRSAPHAGETAGPESIRGALRALGADRLGHGVRAIEDPELLAHLARTRVALEVCPTSNIKLGVYPGLAEHPLARLVEAGAVVTVNSDDPALFGTTIEEEHATLATAFGLAAEACDAILLNAVRASFLPAERKAVLEAEVRAVLAALRPLHLGRG